MKHHARISIATVRVCSAWFALSCGTGKGTEASPSSSGGTTTGGSMGTGGQTGHGGATTTEGSTAGTSRVTGGNASGGNAANATGGTASGGVVATGQSASGGQGVSGGTTSGASTGTAGSEDSGMGGSATGGSTNTGGNATGGSTNTGGSATGGSTGKGGSTTTEGGATGSDGCNGNAQPPTSPSDGYLTIDVKGISREYALELPTGYDGKTPGPVMFAFHGTTTNGQKFLGTSYGNLRAGAGGRVLLVAPNGLKRTGGDTGWLDTGGRGSEINQEDVDFFDALVALLEANYCVDTSRIFAMGHSAGGLISNYLGCIRGNILRGIGPFSGWGPTSSAMGRTISAQCVGNVAAFVGHNPKEGDATECAKLSEGKCPWIVDWETLGWPTVQYWTQQDSCGDIGAMPTAAFDGNSATGEPLPCKSFAGCDASYPVTLCLYDYSNENIGPHAFPTPWGAKAVTDFFLGLRTVP
jgi:poly(3-hydroxybutyrate) depolymerase